MRSERRLRVAGLTLLLAAPLLAARAGAAPLCARADSGVVNVSRTPDMGEGEESLSVNPRNPRQILVGSNQFHPAADGLPVSMSGLMEAASWVSQDGGCTWRATGLETLGGAGHIDNPTGLGPARYRNIGNVLSTDQHSAWDRHGNLWYQAGFLGGIGVEGDQRAMVWRSRDGGRTFDEPVIAYSGQANKAPPDSSYPDTVPMLDRPWLAVDRSGGRYDGTIYLTVSTGPFAFGMPGEVYVTSSRDGGKTWSPSTRVDTGLYTTQMNPREFPVVGADGALYVVYDVAGLTSTVLPLPQLEPISFVVARSTDGGKTFTRHVVDDDVHRVQSPDEALPFYTETISTMAADPRRPGHLAVAWPEAGSRDRSRVVLRTSRDGGRTWSPRQTVSDPEHWNDQHDHPTLTYTPQGELVVVWRDRRASGGTWDSPFQLWARIVGRPKVELTTGPQPSTTLQRGGLIMPSEFIGVAATADSLLVAWDQMTESYADNVFRRIPLSRMR